MDCGKRINGTKHALKQNQTFVHLEIIWLSGKAPVYWHEPKIPTLLSLNQSCQKVLSRNRRSSHGLRPLNGPPFTVTGSGSVESESTAEDLFSNKIKRLYTWKSYDFQVKPQCIDRNQKIPTLLSLNQSCQHVVSWNRRTMDLRSLRRIQGV